MASAMAARESAAWTLSRAECQEVLLSHLYQHLVRYTELNIRHAVRLDHAPSGDTASGDAHPLAYLLTSDEGRDPLRTLLEREADRQQASGLDAHGSLAGAYVCLLRNFDNRMSDVAAHLRISLSYAYRCCAKARSLATHMTHIPVMSGDRFVPGPWRLFRLRRPHVQLAFDFQERRLI